MQPNRKLTASILLAFTVGLGTGAAIQAQHVNPPRGYEVAEIDVKDLATYQSYAAKVPQTLASFGGTYLVRGGKTQTLEGSPPAKRIVVIAFDSVAKAQAWYDSPAYDAIKPLRHKSAETRAFIVEGVTAAP
jgi:uncharacterized protein (DUF1330 family)